VSDRPTAPRPDASGPSRSARKPKGEGHSRRAEILSAAERIFVELGYEGATIRKIADEVGLSSTALYMHFREKSEILHEICRQAYEERLAANRAIIASDAPPETRLRRMAEAYIEFGFQHPNAYRLIYMTRPSEAEDAQSVSRELGAELFRGFESVVAEVAAEGRLRGEPRVAAQTLWAGAHGVISLMITKPYFAWSETPSPAQAMIDALFLGLIKS
jgi:AcrR family transcriptional regulator